jgi:hypothetical protein
MELSARLGSLMPYRKAADVFAEFLPVKCTESFVTVRHRTLSPGKRLDEKREIELDLPNDPEREFVGAVVMNRNLRGAVIL